MVYPPRDSAVDGKDKETSAKSYSNGGIPLRCVERTRRDDAGKKTEDASSDKKKGIESEQLTTRSEQEKSQNEIRRMTTQPIRH